MERSTKTEASRK
ncbi:hypothetical protein IEO21_10846 [Rhodonia placenta]|uniref:Uncharacterized protein n=1 Tax=Rhodonia placenta TaxID=104341 RepID=A0A8H7NRP9_9APHY|nr:hypothetical protein IEO21_10846 [Postia placenta]